MAQIHRYKFNITNRVSSRPITFLLIEDSSMEQSEEPTEETPVHVSQSAQRVVGDEDGTTKVTFETHDLHCAVYGTANRGSSGGNSSRTLSYKPVRLGPDGTVVALTTREGNPVYDREASSDRKVDAPGGFQIVTDKAFPSGSPANIYVGTGIQDPDDTDSVIPVETFPARAETTYTIVPRPVYYVAVADFRADAGDTVDRRRVTNYVKVDFASARVLTAELEFLSNNNWVDRQGRSAGNGVKVTPSK